MPTLSGIELSTSNRFVRFVGAQRGTIFELVFVVACAVGLALAIQSWAVKPFQIPSASMEPTLDVGQRVLVNRFATRVGADPEIGDVVVFHPPTNAVPEEQDEPEPSQCGVPAGAGRLCSEPGPEEAEQNFIKRVVAGPDDRLRVVDGIPIVDGDPVEGSWETIPCEGPGAPCNYPRAITIPADHYFMMGDNRPDSDDSRYWGPVPRAWIVGEAFATYWPPNRIGSL